MTEELSCGNDNMFIEDVNKLNEISSNSNRITISENNTGDSDVDYDIRFTKTRPKFQRVTESDSDTDKENDIKKSSSQKSDSDDNSNREVYSVKKKSRIRNISDSESDSLSGNDNIKAKNQCDLSRTKIKNNELHDKFKKLKKLKSTCKGNNDHPEVSPEEFDGGDSDNSSEGGISCSQIKQKLKKKISHSLRAICDPDTSDDENKVKVKVKKSKPRSIKLISPKPERMSAKQAMENRQKIKSESNRMLREKEVSLPYHRPKALTLKDIMNRRKPALTSDGKSLPIKMNNDQLKQYALLLEQRQKEMMELCKSDSDEEEQNCQEEQLAVDKSTDDNDSTGNKKILNQENCDLSNASDKIYDNINLEHFENHNTGYNNLNDQSIKDAIVVSEIYDHKQCQESVDNNQENFMNETVIVEEKQEQAMEISISQENIAIPLNILRQDTTNSTEKENQIMDTISNNNELNLNEVNKDTEQESQIISLHYDSEKTELTDSQKIVEIESESGIEHINSEISMTSKEEIKKKLSDEFFGNDFTMEELEEIIENAESNKDTPIKPLPNFEASIEIKPMLTGTPGMVIDLDDNVENTQKKLTGVELLKERFTYFARLKSLEDMEKDREKKFKPGIQHLQLKQKLEEQIAEQRSLEWEKRLQVESQLKTEINANEKEEFDGEDIEKIEAKLEENGVIDEEESSSEEEIDDTEDCKIKDKPRIRNPLIDDEAEVTEDENEDLKKVSDVDGNKESTDTDDNDAGDDNEDDEGENESEDNDDEESSESEVEEQQNKCRKGRILKAFEDSDDEVSKIELDNASQSKNHEFGESQDDDIQLAQPQKTYSSDLFASQECTQKTSNRTDKYKVVNKSLEDLGSQTFSILNSGTGNITDNIGEKNVSSEKIDVICETQPSTDDNFDAIAGMCTAGFTEYLVTPQSESSQLSQSQEIGDDVAALCTGKFYDNPFVSQITGDGENDVENKTEDESITESNEDIKKQTGEINELEKPNDPKPARVHEGENKLLESILGELDDPEFDSPKPNKYFFNATKSHDEDKTKIENTQLKKKFVIESDDETSVGAELSNKKKKRKKRKLENRALQISDDEEEEYSGPDQEAYESEIEEDDNRLVEYDSEENEVEVHAKAPKKKRVGNDFFEQEAELTSEDEWIGSGDEDEAGLDRMEREEGDDDTFHQGKLQRELGEIHIREVLDQDKREVRLLQELLFEDGDLGDGHRQRKFRWKNADGEEESGTNVDEYADTQEDEFESEEQWRKQRHEREMFLRKMEEKDDDANVSINRSAFIKATLASKPTSNTTLEKITTVEKQTNMENTKPHESTEKKTVNIPSPKKPFILLQQNYHNSLLTRGRGALARLAALATPLAGDGDDTPKVNASSNRGNFVFAAITPKTGSKVIKRKADTAPDTPRLLKKIKQESKKNSKSSLLDHL